MPSSRAFCGGMRSISPDPLDHDDELTRKELAKEIRGWQKKSRSRAT